MATRRISSAQDQWLRRPHVTWRRAFPGFAATLDLMAEVLGHETRLLAISAAGLIFVTFGASLVAAYLSPSWTNFETVQIVETWSLVAVALVGGWTSLGSRAWHVRFPTGTITAAWLIVVHVAGPHALGVLRGYGERFSTMAIGVFCLSAFGGAWVASLGHFALAGPRSERPSPGLRRGQFGLDTLLWTMLLVAALFGLWQLAGGIEVRSWFDRGFFHDKDWHWSLLLPASAALVALSVGLGRWRVQLVTCAAYLVAIYGLDGFRLPPGAGSQAAASLVLALVVVWLLRAAGFRKVKALA